MSWRGLSWELARSSVNSPRSLCRTLLPSGLSLKAAPASLNRPVLAAEHVAAASHQEKPRAFITITFLHNVITYH